MGARLTVLSFRPTIHPTLTLPSKGRETEMTASLQGRDKQPRRRNLEAEPRSALPPPPGEGRGGGMPPEAGARCSPPHPHPPLEGRGAQTAALKSMEIPAGLCLKRQRCSALPPGPGEGRGGGSPPDAGARSSPPHPHPPLEGEGAQTAAPLSEQDKQIRHRSHEAGPRSALPPPPGEGRGGGSPPEGGAQRSPPHPPLGGEGGGDDGA